jgi:hypothetical protein
VRVWRYSPAHPQREPGRRDPKFARLSLVLKPLSELVNCTSRDDPFLIEQTFEFYFDRRKPTPHLFNESIER